jgi:hypothetical protein
LPPGIVWRRDKQGFPTPVGAWLRDARGKPAIDLLRDPQRRSRDLFPSSTIGPMLDAHIAGQADRSWQVWRALSTELWLDAFHL